MYNKDVRSWVDDIVNFSTSLDLTTIRISSKNDQGTHFPWSSLLLTDDNVEKFFSTLQEKKQFKFSSEKKQTVRELLTSIALNNDFECFMAISSLQDIQFKDQNETSILLGYLPVLTETKNQYTGEITMKDLDIVLVARQTPIACDGKSEQKLDYHSLNGLYFGEGNIIVCDITLDIASPQIVHEMLHAVIHELRSYLDSAMYDQAENKREEICVHFMTDGINRLNNIHTMFGSITSDNLDNAIVASRFIIGSKKSKLFQIDLKKSQCDIASYKSRLNSLSSQDLCTGLAVVLEGMQSNGMNCSSLLAASRSKTFQSQLSNKIYKYNWRFGK